ncbi:probable beta-D-xylosidase 7 isoform X2 [Triticum aestivum]|uniref:probable beta-D-xylosidase 7 isoform X2 n=1 Tax=Triticum aestivum TaxID=4565 RepID=UPI001D01EB85|nr:probable beta-D-xylosidase 7 isoform X2 [Triticum aestivum]
MGRRTHVVLAAAAPALLLLLLRLHVAAAADPPFSCGAPSSAAFCDRRLPISQRAGDLVSRLTLEEKISQLGDESPAVDRLGVPAYKWWSEALHGVANAGRGVHLDGPLRAATSFPQVILTAASFNPHLWYRIGQVFPSWTRDGWQGATDGSTGVLLMCHHQKKISFSWKKFVETRFEDLGARNPTVIPARYLNAWFKR